MGVKGKAQNRILFLNPGQVSNLLEYADLIAVKVCLFHVKNNVKIKTVIKILHPPNQTLAGQVNLGLLLVALEFRETDILVTE